VNKWLPSREQALQLLKQNKCPSQVIAHCIAVTDYAVDLAAQLKNKGQEVNMDLVEAGGVLHDLGRCKTNKVEHGVVGSEFAQQLGLPQEVVNVIKRHVGAGISEKEAQAMGWPKDNYVPQTLEEKIVCYADKRVDDGKVVPIDCEIKKLQRAGKPEAAERVRKLHIEITKLIGNPP
jgi:uncharacterized protein